VLLMACARVVAVERVGARVRLRVGVGVGVLLGVLLWIVLGVGGAGMTLVLGLVRMVVGVIRLTGGWARGVHALGNGVDPIGDTGLSGHIALVGLRGVVVLSHGSGD
jgi:hypothetical protein